jgi:MGT family glycosyltransferase
MKFFDAAAPDDDNHEILHAWAQAVEPLGAAVAHQTRAEVLLGALLGVVATNAVAQSAHVPWVFINPAYYVGPNPARSIALDQPQMADTFERILLPAAAHAELVLHGTDPAFDIIPDDLPSHHHYVGPLLWTPPGQTPGYVTDEGPPWVLVSLSTMPMADEADLANAAVTALLDHDVRILVTDTEARNALTDDVASNAVHVEPFVPHDAVMERASLFISHGGHGGVSRAMLHGVPMVLVPLGRDQDGVGYRAERLGIAKVVHKEALSVDTVAEAINSVLTDPTYAAASQCVSARVAAMSPAAESVRLIEATFE